MNSAVCHPKNDLEWTGSACCVIVEKPKMRSVVERSTLWSRIQPMFEPSNWLGESPA